MTKILAVGCSMTRGHGLDGDLHDPKLWVNQLFGPIGKVTNLSVTGMNNYWIFLETMSELIRSNNDYDIVIVGWSAIPRYYFHVGLELYSVHTKLDHNDINVNNGTTFSGTWLSKIGDDLKKIHNDHWDILDLVKYTNILVRAQETTPDRKIFFVNTLSPWCRNYFEFKRIVFPSDLDPYEQDLLQVETRDDEEIFALYKMIHSHYSEFGGINEPKWLNLYDSLRSLQIDDVSSTDRHPGYQSQDRYVQYQRPVLLEKLGTN
jgi:hypothetical protein